MQLTRTIHQGTQWIIPLLIVAAMGTLAFVAAARTNTETASSSTTHDEPAHVEAIEGTNLHRVILTERAAERLGIQAAPAVDEAIGGAPRRVVPYAAVIYDANGNTWVYTNSEPLTYVRHPIKVERIDGDKAVLTEGPPAGTQVVTVGVAELYGTEFGVGH